MTAEAAVAARQLSWQQKLAKRTARAETVRTLAVEGCLRRVVGLTLEAEGCEAALGARCLVDTVDGAKLDTEVVGFADERLLLMPVGDMHGVLPNARVRPCARPNTSRIAPVSPKRRSPSAIARSVHSAMADG